MMGDFTKAEGDFFWWWEREGAHFWLVLEFSLLLALVGKTLILSKSFFKFKYLVWWGTIGWQK